MKEGVLSLSLSLSQAVIVMLVFMALLFFLLILLQAKKEHMLLIEAYTTTGHPLPTEMLLINLDSRQDRLTNFQKHFVASDCSNKMKLHRIQAVVGKNVEWKNGLLTQAARSDIERVLETGKRKSHDELTLGAVGCYLSHLKAMEYVVEQDRPMIICEDDLVLPPTFYEKMKSGLLLLEEQKSDNAMLLFHVICTGWEKLKCILKKDNFYEIHQFWSLACYYITPSAAKTILAQAKPLEVQLDAMMSRMIQDKRLSIYAYPIAKTLPGLGTDIQVPLEK